MVDLAAFLRISWVDVLVSSSSRDFLDFLVGFMAAL